MSNKRMRKVIVEEKKLIINDIFVLFDEDKDGYLDYEELKSALKAMGFPTKKVEVLKLLETYDKQSKKLMSFDDFKTVAIDKIMKCNPLEEMKYAFKLMCESNEDGIGIRELKSIVAFIGIEINSDEIESMIHEFDRDGDEIINEEEFLKIMFVEDENAISLN